MTGALDAFSYIHDIPSSSIGLPDGLQTNATKEGASHLAFGIILRNFLYVPTLSVNLISVARLMSNANCNVMFSANLCVLQDRITRNPIGLGKLQKGVFMFQPVPAASVAAVTGEETCVI